MKRAINKNRDHLADRIESIRSTAELARLDHAEKIRTAVIISHARRTAKTKGVTNDDIH